MFFIKSRRKSTIFFGNHKIKIYFILIGKKIESIFWDKIKYFSPISVNSIYTEVEKFSKRPVKNIDYSEIKEKYTVENTTNQILKIID